MQIRLGIAKSAIYNCPDHLIGRLREEFTYTNSAVGYQIQGHEKGRYRIIHGIMATGQAMNEVDAERIWREQLDEMRALYKPCLIRPVEGFLVFPTGLLSRVKKFFVDSGVDSALVDAAVVDLRKKPAETHGYSIAGAPAELRSYQQDALDAALAAHQGSIVAGTGTGKTVVIQELIRRLGLRTLLVVPNLSILGQTEQRMRAYFGRHMVGSFSGRKKTKRKITIACAPSVAASKPTEWEEFDVLIFDECHHTPCQTIERIAYHIVPRAYYRFGFTATYTRTDGATLAIEAAVFPPVHTYSVDEGIGDGFLAKPRFVMFNVNSNSHRKYNGKMPVFAYKYHMIHNRHFNEAVIEHINKMVGQGKQVLVLVREKEHGNTIYRGVPGAVFVRNKGGEKAGDVNLPPFADPEEAVKEFNQKRIKCLIGTSIIGEGTDLVPVDVLFNLMGGTSKVSVMQNIGRALRPAPGKELVWIIDYIHRTNEMLEKHSLKRYNIYKKIGKVDVLDLPDGRAGPK